jgi:hypothetical protein
MNIHELADLLLFTSCTLFVTTVGFAIAWVRARERALRAELMAGEPRATASVAPDKLERAVDAIALEVERISEGQRFVTRLLAERGDAARAASARLESPRVITPH